MDKQSIIKQLIMISDDRQKKSLNFFVKCDIATKLRIFELHRQKFYELKQKNNNLPVELLSLCALIISSNNTLIAHKKFARNDFDGLSIDDIAEISKQRIEIFSSKIKKVKTLEDKIIDKWAVVRSLKLDYNYSFDNICLYLLKKHHIKISKTTLSRFWSKIEKTQRRKNDFDKKSENGRN